MKRPALIVAAVAALFTVAANAETVTFHATMSPKSEVPPKATDGKGTAEVTLDTATKVATYTVTFSDLTGPATMGHLHGPAAPDANAGVMVPFPTPVTSPVHGTATLTDAQMAALMDGKMYANIHTAANPAGELRGQLTK